MDRLQEYFHIKQSNDLMYAEIHCTQGYLEKDLDITEDDLLQYLAHNKINHGILKDHVQLLTTKPPEDQFPIIIARGTPVRDGENGYVQYVLNFHAEVEKNDNWNFRDVMRIPSVQKGQKIATVIPPTIGVEGKNIQGNSIPAKSGKPATIRAGQNVVFQEESLTFFAISDGQVSASVHAIDVFEVYEIKDTLTMKDGNLDFVGSITIHGDVPSGYKVQAGGDVKIFGMVEAAEITAGGSIYVSEGLAGQQKGKIIADNNIHIGNINQGEVSAGKDIFVENSILHSILTANNQIICQRGNIIGGTISAGELIEAKEIGNKLHTKTEITFGVNKLQKDQEEKLIVQKQELRDTLSKLTIIGNKLKERNDVHLNPKLKAAFHKQKKSVEQTTKKLQDIEEMLMHINSSLGDEKKAKLVVNSHVYPNVLISFGKYKKVIRTTHQHVQMKLKNQEIAILNL
ncbi:DUF342 domain-containing protein [Ornithinibacillus salinisoli]|uniref:DUF342 domain-containing protein n=1 Tax=Ornithinibacillus salinisoli TaxID=1848459 RepID=A0ABW4W0G2_9BACI